MTECVLCGGRATGKELGTYDLCEGCARAFRYGFEAGCSWHAANQRAKTKARMKRRYATNNGGKLL